MHELGLARAVAATIRARNWEQLPVQVRVRGGHDDPDAFAAALLAHIRSHAPELLGAAIRIIHFSSTRMCGACANTFQAPPGTDCPECGGVPLPMKEPEELEVALDLQEEDS